MECHSVLSINDLDERILNAHQICKLHTAGGREVANTMEHQIRIQNDIDRWVHTNKMMKHTETNGKFYTEAKTQRHKYG